MRCNDIEMKSIVCIMSNGSSAITLRSPESQENEAYQTMWRGDIQTQIYMACYACYNSFIVGRQRCASPTAVAVGPMNICNKSTFTSFSDCKLWGNSRPNSSRLLQRTMQYQDWIQKCHPLTETIVKATSSRPLSSRQILPMLRPYFLITSAATILITLFDND